MKTIFSGNKKHSVPAFVRVTGDGRGWHYQYTNEPTRQRREEVERIRREWGEKTLYRINVYPRTP